MSMAEGLVFVAMTLLGLGLSAMFSGLETGLYTINRVRLAVRADEGERAAATLRSVLANPTRMLATLLVGNNIANYLGSYGIAAILESFEIEPILAILINASLLIPMLFVFGEILPKDLFRTHTDRWSYRCAGFLRWAGRLLLWTGLVPVVQYFGTLVSRMVGGDRDAGFTARQRMSRLIKEGMGAGVLSEVQTTLADRVLALRDCRVQDEMIGWSDVASVRIDIDRDDLRSVMERRSVTRLPVVDPGGSGGDGGDAVVGVLSTIDALIRPKESVRELMTPPLRLEPTMPVHAALRSMRSTRTALAVVADPRTGRPIGIVTLKDLVEPLTGDLRAW